MKKRNLGPWIALALVTGAILFFHFEGIRLYLVPSESMAPTLRKSDYIGGFTVAPPELKRGDIVVFIKGSDSDYYIKRIIGLPEETIALFFGKVYIDGRKFDEAYVTDLGTENFGPIKIPEGQVFLMGDNRTNSVDSRSFGPVPMQRIIARASFIYNPISRIGRIH